MSRHGYKKDQIKGSDGSKRLHCFDQRTSGNKAVLLKLGETRVESVFVTTHLCCSDLLSVILPEAKEQEAASAWVSE